MNLILKEKYCTTQTISVLPVSVDLISIRTDCALIHCALDRNDDIVFWLKKILGDPKFTRASISACFENIAQISYPRVMTGQANDRSLFFTNFSQHLLNGNPFELVFGGKSPIFFECGPQFAKQIKYLESARIGGTIDTSDSQICSLSCRKSAAEVNAERQITFCRRHLRLRRQYDSEKY